ncbi:MAG: 16S rRNA (guanine(527)-N(7))-methyltransferase RsmG [Bacteroidota bacterium]
MIPFIQKYFPTLTLSQQHQFSALGDLYRVWNDKINVISRKDIDHLYLHHILHSLAIGCAIRFVPTTRILDAGTGGGFPGIPLAILFPEISFTLVDSIGKKIRVVSEIGQELKLKNIEPLHARVESVTGTYDFITGRAVMELKGFYEMARKKITTIQKNKMKNGIFYLSGGDVETQVKMLHPDATINPLTDYFSEPYFISKKLIYIPVL